MPWSSSAYRGQVSLHAVASCLFIKINSLHTEICSLAYRCKLLCLPSGVPLLTEIGFDGVDDVGQLVHAQNKTPPRLVSLGHHPQPHVVQELDRGTIPIFFALQMASNNYRLQKRLLSHRHHGRQQAMHALLLSNTG